MLVRPSHDANAINAVINADSVRPFVGLPFAGYLDFSQAVQFPENLFFMGEHGGFAICGPHSDVKEVHAFILPEGRGKWAIAAAYQTITLCAKQGIQVLIAQIDNTRADVANFARRAGFRPTGATSFLPGYSVYALEIDKCHLQ